MNRMVSRLCACLVAFSLFAALCGGMVARAADGFDYNYTYTYDYWGDERQSPDAYRTSAMLSSVSLGLETPMRAPRGLTVSGNDIYIVDTGNNRILQVARDGENFTLTRVISEISGDITPNTLSAPQDVFVMADGTLFIADTNNNRILKADRNLNLLSVFTRPTDATFDQSMAFLPTKLVCDTTGRVFCLAQNVNRGLMKYEADGTFTGFIGASEVKYTWYELVWRLLSTKEQRAQQASFVPTEYNNIALDSEGFFFVTTQTFNSNELTSGAAKPVRRLNAIGTNILIENEPRHRRPAMGARRHEHHQLRPLEVRGCDRAGQRHLFRHGQDAQPHLHLRQAGQPALGVRRCWQHGRILPESRRFGASGL
jgi:hypothetical protein